MDDSKGMFFIFPNEEPQSFWMRNTYISLDILYVDEQGEIVSIASNTPVQSLDPIPSGKPAKYVVEVNAGYCARHGIEVGDQIEWNVE